MRCYISAWISRMVLREFEFRWYFVILTGQQWAKDKESIKDILDCFEADWDYFCFSEESAWIAGPYKKLKETAEKFQQKGNSLEDEQKDYITKLMDLLGLSNLKNTFVI